MGLASPAPVPAANGLATPGSKHRKPGAPCTSQGLSVSVAAQGPRPAGTWGAMCCHQRASLGAGAGLRGPTAAYLESLTLKTLVQQDQG